MILMHLFHWIICILIIKSGDCKKHIAAVWVDDGNGHTIKAELPSNDAKVLKMHMMDILGLGMPRHRHRHHHHKYHGSAPKFLKEIYDALDERGQAPHFDPQYRATVGAANTIITFVNKVSPLHKTHGSNRQLYFDVSDVPLTYSLIGAELRVHRKIVKKQKHKKLILHVYHVIADKKKEMFVAKTLIPHEGWISINVTEQVMTTIISTGSNVRLRMAVTSYSFKHEITLHEVGITGLHGLADFRPFLIGFFNRPDTENIKTRTIRSLSPKTDYKNPYLAASITHVSSDAPESPPETQCQKRPLHVSFKDLGWEEWVIAPEGYDANFCDGRCQFPILSNMNATNHAIIQTLVKMKNAISDGDRLPPDACCAPKDLTTISVLYYDYSSNVVLKKYPKMIVKTCGCF